MSDMVVQMFDRLQYGFTDRSGRFVVDHYEHLVDEENYIDQMHEQITKYLVRANQFDLDDRMHSSPWLMLLGAIIGGCIAALLVKRQLAKGRDDA